MGKRGSKPQDKTGMSYRSDRHGSKAPNPSTDFPIAPAGMVGVEKQVWREVKRAMEGTTVIRKADRQALVIYCQLVARYREACDWLSEMGPVDTETGKPWGIHQTIRDLLGQIRQWSRELGLTPSSRTTLHDPVQPADPEAEEFGL